MFRYVGGATTGADGGAGSNNGMSDGIKGRVGREPGAIAADGGLELTVADEGVPLDADVVRAEESRGVFVGEDDVLGLAPSA